MATPIDIREELWHAVQAFETGDTDGKLDRLGITRATYWQGPAVLGKQRIRPHRDGSYEPDPEGKPALVVPVSDSYTSDNFDPIDLIAFQPNRPHRLWHRTGAAPLMNVDAIYRADVLGVWDSPLTWLRWNKHGVVILDWNLDPHFWFGGIRELWFADARTRGRFEAKLREPTFPGELFVPEAA